MKGEKEMKKKLFIIVTVLFLSFSLAWAGSPDRDVTVDVDQIGIQTQKTEVNQVGIQETDVRQIQGVKQRNIQYQGDTKQKIEQTFNTEKPFIQPTIVVPNILPQLSFGETKQIKSIITDTRLKEWNGELIIAVVNQTKTTSSKIIKKTIDLVNESAQKEDLRKCRIISLSHPSTKMWSTGGAISVGGVNNVGSGMMSGASGIFPSYGRMTSDNVIDLIIVRVVE